MRLEGERGTSVIKFLGGQQLEQRAKKQGSWAVIRQGLPNSAVKALTERYGLNDDVLSRIMGISVRTLSRRKTSRGTLSATESDRAFRFARIAARVEEIFGDAETAQDWISAPNRALEGVSPIDIMDTDAGVERIEEILTRVERGVYG